MSSIILHNGRLIDGTGKIWDRVDIHIEGTHIRNVSPECLQDTQAEFVDLSGKTVIPGLMNCHTHICGGNLEMPPGVTSTQLVAEYAVRGARWLEQALKKGAEATPVNLPCTTS